MKTLLHIKMMAMGLFIFLLAGNNLKAQEDFIKHEDNPIFEGYDDGPSNVHSPVVIYDDGVYKMWFEGDGNSYNSSNIFYSESDNGIDWDENDEPVISSGADGDWNRDKKPGSVILVNDSILKMWYSASSDGFNLDLSIGYAWRYINDTVWNLPDEPVLEHDSFGTWDETGVFFPVVYYDTTAVEDEKYKMWYHGFEGTLVTELGRIGYATSPDGIDWTRYPENPVIEVESGSYYDTWIIPTSVLFYAGEYHLYFTGWDGTGTNPWRYFTVGHATSENGTDWVYDDISPDAVLNVGASGDWDWRIARYGSVLFVDNIFKMWYEGLGSAYKIGYAADSTLTLGISDLNTTLTNQIIISPNPTNDITTISYHLATASTTSIVIYNQQGQLITTLLNEKIQVGDHEIKFDSSEFPSGIYFCVLKTMDRIQTQKMVKM